MLLLPRYRRQIRHRTPAPAGLPGGQRPSVHLRLLRRRAPGRTRCGRLHNVLAHPEFDISVGDGTTITRVPVRARVLTGQERDAIYSIQSKNWPQFGRYAEITTRDTIPVVETTRAVGLALSVGHLPLRRASAAWRNAPSGTRRGSGRASCQSARPPAPLPLPHPSPQEEGCPRHQPATTPPHRW